jgi:hypothetical protein
MIAKVAADLTCVTPSLRSFVYEILCQSNQLKPSCYPLTEIPLLRRGDLCGILFCLHGPRLVKLTAVWDRFTNQVVFYNAAGERYLSTQVPDPLPRE